MPNCRTLSVQKMKDVSHVHHMEVIENVAVKMFFLSFVRKECCMKHWPGCLRFYFFVCFDVRQMDRYSEDTVYYVVIFLCENCMLSTCLQLWPEEDFALQLELGPKQLYRVSSERNSRLKKDILSESHHCKSASRQMESQLGRLPHPFKFWC